MMPAGDAPTYPYAAPAPGQLAEVQPGLLWLRLALPLALDHVNVWVLDEPDGWTVVDAGLGDAATFAAWETLLAGPLAGRPVRRLLVTHFHPDHAGAAGWLAQRTGAALHMPRTEWLLTRLLTLDVGAGFAEAGERHERRCGLDEATIALRRARGNLYARSVSALPDAATWLANGDLLTLAAGRAEVIVGRGHAPEMACLALAGRSLLIAADQILPRITPVVGVWPSLPEADPLGDFLASLQRFAALPEDWLVLPSHGLPFFGLRQRVAALADHHEGRLERTAALCAAPVTAAQVMRGLFARAAADPALQGFALAETLAHLHALLARGRLERVMAKDGAWRFTVPR